MLYMCNYIYITYLDFDNLEEQIDILTDNKYFLHLWTLKMNNITPLTNCMILK